MIRAILATLMLLALGLAFGTPTASATCIDANPTDDNGVGTQGCQIPVGGDCKVLVYGQLPGISSSCAPYDCVDGVQDCDGTDK